MDAASEGATLLKSNLLSSPSIPTLALTLDTTKDPRVSSPHSSERERVRGAGVQAPARVLFSLFASACSPLRYSVYRFVFTIITLYFPSSLIINRSRVYFLENCRSDDPDDPPRPVFSAR